MITAQVHCELPGTGVQRMACKEKSRRQIERHSAAATLSDLELIVFPDLLFGLVLANILSPIVWKWRDDPWFQGVRRLTPYRRILRVKQFIMEHYQFNLDLDTWGLTTKQRELERFRGLVSEDELRRLNPFFGCERDGPYSELDLRTCFGLQDYPSHVIPYWKTETVEAMDAFRHRPGYRRGAGECVSLAALYAAALFIVARIPLEDIYLMLTPLHCHAFVDVGEGLLTNNRRVITKRMWFNGTELSSRARRALQNERITLVTHATGWVRTAADRSTIDKVAYGRLGSRLRSYLSAPLTKELLGNFLRQQPELQEQFQLRWNRDGLSVYVALEDAFARESGTPFRVTGRTRDKLLSKLDGSEFQSAPIPQRVILNDVEEFLPRSGIDLDRQEDVLKLAHRLRSTRLDAGKLVEALARFCRTTPRLPSLSSPGGLTRHTPLNLSVGMDRRQVMARLLEARRNNELAEMAFHVYRDLNLVDTAPFLLAAVQGNPVSVRGVERMFGGAGREGVLDNLLRYLGKMPATSIYPGAGRLAQPDEVWNFGRGDGVEKALLLANVLHNRNPEEKLTIEVSPNQSILRTPFGQYRFSSTKGLSKQTWAIPVA